MKMDKQHRLLIEKHIREKFEITNGIYYLIYKTNNNIIISKKEIGKVIAKVTVDSKGRFVVPTTIYDIFCKRDIVMYYEEEGEVGILFF